MFGSSISIFAYNSLNAREYASSSYSLERSQRGLQYSRNRIEIEHVVLEI